ncbi:unnamed protein product [marine sediment metagenome]|uniref:Uncharacterized protein n=1 Tax=marine sediment metagenome TaxID=412755 RepID=X0Y7H9_9ZZZZ
MQGTFRNNGNWIRLSMVDKKQALEIGYRTDTNRYNTFYFSADDYYAGFISYW